MGGRWRPFKTIAPFIICIYQNVAAVGKRDRAHQRWVRGALHPAGLRDPPRPLPARRLQLLPHRRHRLHRGQARVRGRNRARQLLPDSGHCQVRGPLPPHVRPPPRRTVKTLDVVSTSLRKLVGSPPCTLQDYFQRETRGSSLETPPQKRVKLNEEQPQSVRIGTPEPRKTAK